MSEAAAKNVLITGGSGAVGRALVKRFCQDGCGVAFTWRRHQEATEALMKETGACGFQADLTDGAQVGEMVELVLERLKQIDILVNNAGATQVMPFPLIEEEDWDAMMADNLKSMFLVTRAVARGMVLRKAGVIVNIGSLAGQRMLDVPVHYATAKAGVNGFTMSLAKEFSRYRIRVNSVAPGLLDDGVGKMVPDKELEKYCSHCATGRPGTPAEIAGLVAFLASEEATYINGQTILVDGGL